MTGELSGVDLARQALIAAREAARMNGATTRKPKRRTTTAVGRDGREPLRLGSAIGMMMTERGMVAPAAGGSVLADFDAILAAAVPELAGRVQATAFDADTGRLDVVPDAPAVGTKLRWSAPKLIAAANERVRGANVRAVHVLAPAPVRTGPTITAAAAPALKVIQNPRSDAPDTRSTGEGPVCSPLRALTCEASIAASSISSSPSLRSLASRTSCRRGHTPASVQSRRRRQAVTPLHPTSSAGTSRQLTLLRST
ncbi:DUF721 domain-containing protein [Streptomyces olivaceus]|uniref:DUF721 domain-containing protein n=1 Tax=Streptomyces olivaceus TaxID=47716 RepID=UPI003FF07506